MVPVVTLGAISFNTSNSYIINGIPGLFVSAIRRASFDLPGANFGQFVQSFYGRRRFSLQGWVVGTSWTDFVAKRDALAAAVDISGGEHTIVFTLPDGSQRQIVAGLIGQTFDPVPDYVAAGQFSLDFEAAFPFLTSGSNTQVLTLAVSGGGTVPAIVPMSLSSNIGGTYSLTNTGTAPAFPTARIFGPVVNPALRNLTLGIDLQLTITLTTGQYLDVDFTRHTVVDQGGANQYAALGVPQWWAMQPGANQIAFVADTYNATASVNFNWPNTFINL